MKILNKKQVSEILKRITANEIICIEYMKDIDAQTHLIENNAEIAYLVGGINGMNIKGVVQYMHSMLHMRANIRILKKDMS